MAISNKKTKTTASSVIIILIIAVIKFCNPSATSATKASHSSPAAEPVNTTAKPEKKSATPPTTQTKNGWQIHSPCTLIEHRNNDGDSFLVKLPNQSQAEYRLYFVDTPESLFKKYRDGSSNAKRISDQARYFGNLTPEQSTALGKTAKAYTLDLLKNYPFELSTKNEAVYQSGRYYCHIRVQVNGAWKYLDEILTEKGYVRIITQPANLPDGTSADKHRGYLKQLESEAKKKHLGGWQ